MMEWGMRTGTKGKVLKLHGEGITLSEIAQRLGLTVGAVRYHLPKNPQVRASAKERQLAVRLYAQGRTQEEIGAELGFSGASVGQWLRAAGVVARTAGPAGHAQSTRRAAAARYRKGEGIAKISADLNVSGPTVRKWIRQAGVALRPRRNKNRSQDTTSRDTIESWAMAHDNGQSITQLARDYGTTKRTVSKLLKLHGFDVRKPGAPPKVAIPSREQLATEYGRTRSLDEVAAIHGVTRWTVKRWLGVYGIETYSRGSQARPPRQVFDEYTPDRPPGGCWEWTGVVAPTGYGIAHLREDGVSTRMGAHRLSYVLHEGDIARGLVVRHTCHNRLCCNPSHLLVGTHQDNANDRVRAGNKGIHRDSNARNVQHRDNRSRLMARIRKDPDSGCWIWKGGKRKSGYGVMVWNPRSSDDPRNMVTHRASYILHNGDIPKGMLVRHLCHVKLCVNPEHLAVGSPKANSKDEADAGKLRVGEAHHRTSITEDQVREMRELRIAGWPIRRLATKFGVSQGAVCAATVGRTWRHVDGPLYVPGSNKGVGNPSAKLSAEDVRRIRHLSKKRLLTQALIAEEYSVSAGTIAHIVHGRTWKHVSYDGDK